ncbi:spore germination protein GerPC [Tepidibacillus marianensis]|uniref:spore germination protein GerPC n=1 Tax=Tepidibacillus marianensis TaxID=3131995 RepID=UPI0030D3B20D
MYPDPSLYKYMEQLQKYVEWQNERIGQMNQTIEQLQAEMNQIKKKKNVTVERVEYKFDQLKVERLEGTLNIGITPNGSGAIEDLDLNNQHFEDYPVQTQSVSPMFSKIKTDITNYLNKDIYDDIHQIEEKNHFYVKDENYRLHMIEDIKKQIDERIQFYLNQQEDPSINESTVHQTITKKLKQDIQNAIQNFFQNFFHKESS